MSQNSPAPTSKSATATKSAKKIKELQEKRDGLQQKISQQEALLRSTKKDVRSQLNDLALITGQIDERKNYIHTIEGDVNILTADIADLQKQLDILEEKLKERKHRYEQSVKYMYRNRTVQDKLMFIFSAKSFSQLYRRMRYVREYAVYQRAQGEIIAEKERQILEKRSELLNVKGAKDNLLQQGVHEQKVLEGKQMEQRKIVDDLKKK
ncbi:MAG: peptidase M23, partial [Bacteroidaceae bacterium]|nr:peptidase M23 [Bacteroidaceae bacterium]